MGEKASPNSFVVNEGKLADFQTYCQRCKYFGKKRTVDYPCYCCIGTYGRGMGHQIPERFVERGTGKKEATSIDSAC